MRKPTPPLLWFLDGLWRLLEVLLVLCSGVAAAAYIIKLIFF